jgi:hypothetical protein
MDFSFEYELDTAVLYGEPNGYILNLNKILATTISRMLSTFSLMVCCASLLRVQAYIDCALRGEVVGGLQPSERYFRRKNSGYVCKG